MSAERADSVVAVVEVPRGSRNKYEIDHETGAVWLDRVLATSTQYPVDYGFIPDTSSEDGDPLDIMVIMDEPSFPGCHMRVRPIGVLFMADEKGPDPKILSVALGDPMYGEVEDLYGVPRHLLDEIEHFFGVYKQLEPEKQTLTVGWRDADVAWELISESR